MVDIFDKIVPAFLDLEYQKISNITPWMVDRYSRLLLLLSKTVVVTPTPFFESEISFVSPIFDLESQASGRVLSSYREVDLDAFLKKKSEEYNAISASYAFYTDARADRVLERFSLPRVYRDKQIGEGIAREWLRSVDSDAPGSLKNVAACYDDSNLRARVLTAFSEMPERLAGEAFVWERVCQEMALISSDWDQYGVSSLVRAFINKSYFHSFCGSELSVTAFDDFSYPKVEVTETLSEFPLQPLYQFFLGSGVASIVWEMKIPKLIEIASSYQARDFGNAYTNILELSTGRLDAGKRIDALVGSEREQYNRASEHRKFSFASHYLYRLGGALSKRLGLQKWNGSKTPFLSLLECFTEFDSEFGTAAALHGLPPEQVSERVKRNVGTKFYVRGDIKLSGDTYNVGQAGAVGKHASASSFEQNFSGFSQQQILSLRGELETIESFLRSQGRQLDPEKLEKLSIAKEAALSGDNARTMAALKKCGSWLLDTAREARAPLVVEALKLLFV